MKTADGKQVYINSAVLIHEEPAKLGKAQYRGGGEWLLEICDMDRDFSRAAGYELYDTDWRMGYSTYRKTVTAEVFTGIKLDLTVNGAHYEAVMPIPERLREEMVRCAEREGDTRLTRGLANKLMEEYGADAVYDSILR